MVSNSSSGQEPHNGAQQCHVQAHRRNERRAYGKHDSHVKPTTMNKANSPARSGGTKAWRTQTACATTMPPAAHPLQIDRRTHTHRTKGSEPAHGHGGARENAAMARRPSQGEVRSGPAVLKQRRDEKGVGADDGVQQHSNSRAAVLMPTTRMAGEAAQMRCARRAAWQMTRRRCTPCTPTNHKVEPHVQHDCRRPGVDAQQCTQREHVSAGSVARRCQPQSQSSNRRVLHSKSDVMTL